MLNRFNNFLKKKIHEWLFTYHYEIICDKNGKIPRRVYHDDAGYDLYISESVIIAPFDKKDISTGIFCNSAIPAWMFLTGRSSTLMKYGLVVDNGIIDGGYTGELFIKIINTKNEEVYLKKGTRIGQIIIIPHTSIKFFSVGKFSSEKIRGYNGFGSTGK